MKSLFYGDFFALPRSAFAGIKTKDARVQGGKKMGQTLFGNICNSSLGCKAMQTLISIPLSLLSPATQKNLF
ncbi:MAG: hypothetical protein U5L09_05140 [Bacteroidales bacterium]|nr:hypothetical protein [Bacteroidales bacterium]